MFDVVEQKLANALPPLRRVNRDLVNVGDASRMMGTALRLRNDLSARVANDRLIFDYNQHNLLRITLLGVERIETERGVGAHLDTIRRLSVMEIIHRANQRLDSGEISFESGAYHHDVAYGLRCGNCIRYG